MCLLLCCLPPTTPVYLRPCVPPLPPDSHVQLELDAINRIVTMTAPSIMCLLLCCVPPITPVYLRPCVPPPPYSHVQLELDAINRIVTVKKEDVLGKQNPSVMPVRGSFGFNPNVRPSGGYGFTPGGAGVPRTPAHVTATPMHPSMGGSTPVHPSRVSQRCAGLPSLCLLFVTAWNVLHQLSVVLGCPRTDEQHPVHASQCSPGQVVSHRHGLAVSSAVTPCLAGP
jgi:hypothetical protein